MRVAVAFLVVTILVGLSAALWSPVVAARLIQLPDDFDTTIGATGTFVAQAAPGTLARLPTPLTQPLVATIQVQATGVSGNNIIVSSTTTQTVGTLAPLTTKSQFVIDRRTAQNVNDPQSWSFDPAHVVNRGGSYSFTFGFDFDPAGSYPIWDDTIGASYPLTQGGSAGSANAGGLAVVGMTGTTTAPADPAWLATLTPLQLPSTLTPEQWSAAGIPVTSTAPSVTVNYIVTISTQVSVDPITGGTGNLTQYMLTLGARPDPSATGGTPANPQTVFVSTVGESESSVGIDTDALRADGDRIVLARTTVPRLLGLITALLAAITVLLFVRARRHPSRDASGSSTRGDEPATEKAAT